MPRKTARPGELAAPGKLAPTGKLARAIRRTLRPKALHGKLILVVLTALGLGLALAAGATFIWLKTTMLGRVDVQLTNTSRFAVSYIAQVRAETGKIPDFGADRPGPGSPEADWEPMAQSGLLPSYLEFRDVDGHVVRDIAPGGPVPALPADLGSRLPAGKNVAFFEVRSATAGSGERFRVRAERLPGGAGFLLLAMPISDIERLLHTLAFVEMGLWVVTFAVVGWVATRRIRTTMRPLDLIGSEAMAIHAGDLDRRVTPVDPETEVGRLGIAVNTMLGRLESAFAERQASEDRLRRFVADASHELRTPLTSIRGYAELFRRGAADRPEDLALAMARIESEAARMGGLVEELLLLARLDSGRPLEREPVDLVALAHDAVADFRVAAPMWPVEAELSPASVLGDADRLRQVLVNLLGNVRQHTPPGTSARLRVWAEAEDDTAVVEVEDTGPGMTEEHSARVFERFFRGDKSRSRAMQSADGTTTPKTLSGTGLGLSIVSAIVGAHGGSATVCAKIGEGTTFRVVIPRAGIHS